MCRDLPSLLHAEGGKNILRGLKSAVAQAQGSPHPVVAKSHNVGMAAVGQRCQTPGMQINPPSSGLVAKGRQHNVGIRKGAVALAESGPHSAIAESDDVRMAAVG